jgi:peptide/nickel transport system permease protein
MLPQVTALALSFGYLLSGSTLVEVVFGYPGLGNILVNAIRGVDYPVMQGIIFTIILSLALATLLVDLGLPLLDPRISYGRTA